MFDDDEDRPIGDLRPRAKAPAAEPPAQAAVEAEPPAPAAVEDKTEFIGLPLPQDMRAHFEVEFTPASLLRYDPEAWDLPEIKAALVTLHQLEASSPSARRRKWATRELDLALAAWRGRSTRGANAGEELDAEVLKVVEQVEELVAKAPPGTEIVISEPVNPGEFELAWLVRISPGESWKAVPLGDYTEAQKLKEGDEFQFRIDRGPRLPATKKTASRVAGAIFGLTLGAAEMRAVRAREAAGKKRIKYRGRGRRR